MLGAGIHLQILHNGFAKARFGEHAFDSLLDEKRRFLRQVIGRRSETLTSRETGVSCVDLVGHLLARQPYLVGVHDDNVVAAIDVGCLARLVLAAEDLRNLRCKTSQYLVGRVDDNPLLVNRSGVRRDSFVA